MKIRMCERCGRIYRHGHWYLAHYVLEAIINDIVVFKKGHIEIISSMCPKCKSELHY